MSEFIAVGRAKKLKNFPQPDISRGSDARADAEFRGVEKELPEEVVDFTPGFSDETHVHDRAGVPEKVHACESSGACV
jgi:hypothetical protein